MVPDKSEQLRLNFSSGSDNERNCFREGYDIESLARPTFLEFSAGAGLVREGLKPAWAGVESEYRGSHLFRHSLASQMLKHGASLLEIGDLLRHRRPDTTRIYAKVDLVSLRSIAPWPGGIR